MKNSEVWHAIRAVVDVRVLPRERPRLVDVEPRVSNRRAVVASLSKHDEQYGVVSKLFDTAGLTASIYDTQQNHHAFRI